MACSSYDIQGSAEDLEEGYSSEGWDKTHVFVTLQWICRRPVLHVTVSGIINRYTSPSRLLLFSRHGAQLEDEHLHRRAIIDSEVLESCGVIASIQLCVLFHSPGR